MVTSGIAQIQKWVLIFSGILIIFMGLILGLLPCGPVYTVLIASARAGWFKKGSSCIKPVPSSWCGGGHLFCHQGDPVLSA
ncbi:MAG: hypothetical protein A2277_21520 [Desulfobacterales bacterium RIFOXYA12_FULL_46_15]|nr:MAG: hypothetical protein A2277_21520 [Desulfobacterales bacterium RIFOXYA12_FULL_46_15]